MYSQNFNKNLWNVASNSDFYSQNSGYFSGRIENQSSNLMSQRQSCETVFWKSFLSLLRKIKTLPVQSWLPPLHHWLSLYNVWIRRSLIGPTDTCPEASWLTWLWRFSTWCSFSSTIRAAEGAGGAVIWTDTRTHGQLQPRWVYWRSCLKFVQLRVAFSV